MTLLAQKVVDFCDGETLVPSENHLWSLKKSFINQNAVLPQPPAVPLHRPEEPERKTKFLQKIHLIAFQQKLTED